MDTLVTNLINLVAFPSVVLTGVLYAVHRSLDAFLSPRPDDARWTALLAAVAGLYFLGHPRYPALVPLIRAATSWVFAIGGVYVTLGVASLVHVRYRRLPTAWAWVAAAFALGLGLFAANDFAFEPIVRLVGSNDFDPALNLVLPLVLLFPLGYGFRGDDRKHSILAVVLVFTSCALVLANSIPLTEPVRGPVVVVFLAFGCVGVLFGIPMYVLGSTLQNEREVRVGN